MSLASRSSSEGVSDIQVAERLRSLNNLNLIGIAMTEGTFYVFDMSAMIVPNDSPSCQN